jgi:hypothetical protein
VLSKNPNEAIFVFVGLWVTIFVCCIEGAVPKEMPMLMTFSASEQNVLIINGLQPFLIVIF